MKLFESKWLELDSEGEFFDTPNGPSPFLCANKLRRAFLIGRTTTVRVAIYDKPLRESVKLTMSGHVDEKFAGFESEIIFLIDDLLRSHELDAVYAKVYVPA